MAAVIGTSGKIGDCGGRLAGGKSRLMLRLVVLLAFVLADHTASAAASQWTFAEYGSPTIQRTNGVVDVSSEAGAGGLYFRRSDLLPDKVYRLELTGTRRSGDPFIRLQRDNRPFEYLDAPPGRLDVVVSRTARLELLIYGTSPFSYQVDVALGECADCMTDARLREIVRADLPAIDDDLKSDPLWAIDRLLGWTSRVVDLGGSVPKYAHLVGAMSIMPASQIYEDIWLSNSGGATCGGFAVFFQKLLALFEIQSLTADSGYLGTFLTHTTSIVPMQSGDRTKFYVFDPTFGGTYRSRADGGYVDLESVLDETVPAFFKAEPISRTLMVPNTDAEGMFKFIAGLGQTPRCQTISAGDYMRCDGVLYGVNFLRLGWAEWLRQQSIPADADLILTFMRKQVISVSDTAGGAVKKEFQAMVNRALRSK